MTRVEICGLGFSGSEIPEGGLTFSELIDWDGVPGTRGDSDPIPDANGSYTRTNIVRLSRAISVNAAIVADTPAEFIAARQRVEALPAQGEMRVDLGDGYWTRHVEIQAIKIPDARAGSETEFTIDLVAPDPARYRDPIVVGPVGLPVRDGGLILPSAFPWNFGTSVRSVASVENSGSVPSYPTVRVTGSGAALSVQGGPRRVEFGAFSGEFVIDNLQRRAFLNGGDVTRQLLRRDWQSVPAGGVQDFSFDVSDASPDTVMTVEYRIGVW